MVSEQCPQCAVRRGVFYLGSGAAGNVVEKK